MDNILNTDGISEMLRIENQIKDLIKSYLGIPIGGILQSCSIFPGQPISTNVRASEKNYDYENTRYSFKENKFIHFTSLKVLFSIIREKSLRLYNLNNSSDKHEYTYSVNKFRAFYERKGWDEKRIIDYLNGIKDDSFILSCASTNDVESKEHWKRYADNGNGVAIEFEIMNNPLVWEGWYCSKVRYGELDDWDKFTDQVIQLGENSKYLYDFYFDQILCLHKDPSFSEEKEIRILGQSCYSPILAYSSMKYHDVSKDGNTYIHYFKLPLYLTNGLKHGFEKEFERMGNVYHKQKYIDEYMNLIPLLKISKVRFCQDFPYDDNYFRIESNLRNDFFKAFGYDLTIERI